MDDELHGAIEALKKQIAEKVALHRTLVGTLYPGILAEEIGALQLKLQDLEIAAGKASP